MSGTKHDQGKPRLELLDRQWLWGVAEVMTFGAQKYAADNWRQGISVRRLIGAALRHTTAWMDGEDRDPESGRSHLLHASCCLMMAYWTWLTRPELDDRYVHVVSTPMKIEGESETK